MYQNFNFPGWCLFSVKCLHAWQYWYWSKLLTLFFRWFQSYEWVKDNETWDAFMNVTYWKINTDQNFITFNFTHLQKFNFKSSLTVWKAKEYDPNKLCAIRCQQLSMGQGQLGFILVVKVGDNGTKLKCFLCFITTLESQSHDITHIHSWQETESAPNNSLPTALQITCN